MLIGDGVVVLCDCVILYRVFSVFLSGILQEWAGDELVGVKCRKKKESGREQATSEETRKFTLSRPDPRWLREDLTRVVFERFDNKVFSAIVNHGTPSENCEESDTDSDWVNGFALYVLYCDCEQCVF